jgi:hypothetical protein
LKQAGKQADSLHLKELQALWQSIVAILNKFGWGNAQAWLKEFPGKIDGWMNEATIKIKASLDAIQDLLNKADARAQKYRSWIEVVVDKKTLDEFLSRLRLIKQALVKTYTRMEAAKAQVNQWLREQVSKLLGGKHHFPQAGASGTPASPIKNTRVQEAKEPPKFENPAKKPESPPKKSGETEATAAGKKVHKQRADQRRSSGQWDDVDTEIKDSSGNSIEVPARVDKTGRPVVRKGTKTARPDAVSYKRGQILDDKPLGRPISKDRQQIIGYIKAYEKKTGTLPKEILIERYDPATGKSVMTEILNPKQFVPWKYP